MAETATRGSLAIRERPELGKLLLRSDGETAETAGEVLGLSIPKAMNHASGGDTLRALRLGPDEFLLIMAKEAVATTLATLDQMLSERHRALVDLSARLVAVEVDGPAARDTLAAACPLDLHPSALGPGQATRTVLGKIEIILDCLAPDHFRLLANRSHVPYLHRLVVEAGREHGVAAASSGEPYRHTLAGR